MKGRVEAFYFRTGRVISNDLLSSMILRLKLGQDFKSKGHHPLHPVTHPIFCSEAQRAISWYFHSSDHKAINIWHCVSWVSVGIIHSLCPTVTCFRITGRDSFPFFFRANEVSPHARKTFQILTLLNCKGMKGAPISWRKWMSGSYQSCGGKFLRWTNQICGLSSRSSIGRPLAHIMSSEMMADCGWLDPWQQQRRNAECSNGRGPVSRKRWGSGTYMSYMCHKFVIYMSYRSYIRIKWNI